MKLIAPLFILLLLSFNSKAQEPLTINDIMDIKTLVYKKDLENLLKFLNYNGFEFTKKEENYDHGSFYVFVDFKCIRPLPELQNPRSAGTLDYHPEEKLEVSYIDKGEFTELWIGHSFLSDGDDFKTTFDYLQNMKWIFISVGNPKKAHDLNQNLTETIPGVKPYYNTDYGYELDGWDGKHTYKVANEFPLIFKDSYKKFSFSNVSDNKQFNQTYSAEIQPSIISKKMGYLIRNDSCLFYNVSIYETIPKYSSEDISSGLPIYLQIPLIKSGDIFFVNVIIGNANKKYVFDSGASDVTINQTIYNKLLADRTIQFKHRLPKGSYQLADGSVKEYQRTLIPKITIGGRDIYNIAASVVPDDQPLLLGKSFLDKFKSWKIDNNKSTLLIEIK